MKKLSIFLMIITSLFLVTGCGSKKEENKNDEPANKTENVEGALEDLMTKVYEDIPEEERPMMLMNTEVNEENVEYYLGTTEIEYEEALASESGVGSIPHSVVLVRVKENANVEEIKKTIKDSVNPRKWICVEAEEVVVESRGDLIILIMASSNVDKLQDGFNNL